jgi:hypothetical protein
MSIRERPSACDGLPDWGTNENRTLWNMLLISHLAFRDRSPFLGSIPFLGARTFL